MTETNQHPEGGCAVYDRATEAALAAIAIGVGGGDNGAVLEVRSLRGLLRATGVVNDAVVMAMRLHDAMRRQRAREAADVAL